MPQIRLYCSSELKLGASVELTAEQISHTVKVLRVKSGESVLAFNQVQGEFLCSLEKSSNWVLLPIEHLRNPEKNLAITIGIGLIKRDKFRLAIEAATQLGCSRIVPIKCEYSQFEAFNKEKAVRQIIGSVEQSRRCSIPQLSDPISLKDFISSAKLVVCANELSDSVLPCQSLPAGELHALVGPEGGFSPKEQLMLSESNNVMNASLGPFVLRSEVAVCCLLFQIFYLQGVGRL